MQTNSDWFCSDSIMHLTEKNVTFAGYFYSMIKLFIPALIIVLLAMAGLGLSFMMNRLHFYRHSHVESNPHLRRQGITCAKQEEISCQRSTSGCAGCGLNKTLNF